MGKIILLTLILCLHGCASQIKHPDSFSRDPSSYSDDLRDVITDQPKRKCNELEGIYRFHCRQVMDHLKYLASKPIKDITWQQNDKFFHITYLM